MANQHHHLNSESPTVTSTSLLERVRRMEGDAWNRFVTLYCPLIYDTCRKYRLDPVDADDVVQEVLQSVSHAIGDFKKERPSDSFRGWLYRIVQNKIRDHFRRAKKRPAAAGGSDNKFAFDLLPEELSDDSVSQAVLPTNLAVRRALEMIRSEFQESTWTAFWRLTVEGHTAAEIAADLGMNRNSVRQAKFRVIQRLRVEFADLIDFPN